MDRINVDGQVVLLFVDTVTEVTLEPTPLLLRPALLVDVVEVALEGVTVSEGPHTEVALE